jgi:hypothetical protein
MLWFRDVSRRDWSTRAGLLLLVAGLAMTAVAAPRGEKRKPEAKPEGLANIPLPIGHEAKGIVLPDFDMNGKMRGRFEASVAKRVDEGHVEFGNLKMLTYDEAEKPELEINMSDSVLDLSTRVLSSRQRTTVKRADFEIAGDTMSFDTNTREGRLKGNVKMVLLDRSRMGGDKPE